MHANGRASLFLCLVALVPLACASEEGERASTATQTDSTDAPSWRVTPAGQDGAAREPDPEVRVRVRREGSGEPAAAGRVVRLHYTAWVQGEEDPFATTRGLYEPLTVTLGTTASVPLIRGFELGLMGLSAGTHARIEVPPGLAYGDDGPAARDIPPDATLVFDVEILSVR